MRRVNVPRTGSWDDVCHYGLRIVKTSYMNANGASENKRDFRANIDGEGATDWVVVRVMQEFALVGRAHNEHMFYRFTDDE
jgi:hypothetical protein